MRKHIIIMTVKSSLILCAILLLSVTNASSPVSTNIDTTNLEKIRAHNLNTLRVIERSLSGDAITPK